MTTACPRTPRGKKQKQQTDPHGEDKKKKQNGLRMNIRNQARNQDFMWGGANEAKVDF